MQLQLQLLDEETGVKKLIYTLNVTEEEYARAIIDLTYCTQLLENAKRKLKESNDTAEKEADDNETYNDGFRWVDQAIRLLLTAYKEHEELLIKGKVSVKKFWKMISEVLKEKSYNITGPQCKSKFHGLKKTYKKIKDHNAKSGNSRRTWPYFEIMDEMFGHKSWTNPILTLDSANIPSSNSLACSSSDTTSLSPKSPSSSASSSSGRRRKRQKVNETVLEDLVAIAQENKEERRNMYKETAARQERLLCILENIANKM